MESIQQQTSIHFVFNSTILSKQFSNAEHLGAGGKSSTWLLPGRLVEHNSNSRGAVTKHANDKENKTEQHNQHHSKH